MPRSMGGESVSAEKQCASLATHTLHGVSAQAHSMLMVPRRANDTGSLWSMTFLTTDSTDVQAPLKLFVGTCHDLETIHTNVSELLSSESQQSHVYLVDPACRTQNTL